ncbi:glycoside hydrolase family 61 protein [Panaeolus papilionaceus]|nr:glycoside hydrolase family 61 protein [Panaeolus papilionaceus]
MQHLLTFASDIWNTLIAGGTQSTAAVRQPANNSPVEQVSSGNMRCNGASPNSASQTLSISAGQTLGFRLDNTLYHSGPAAIYIAKAPGSVQGWDGSGSWVKIAQWGATFNPFKFVAEGQSVLTTTLPNVSAGEYLVRIEQIGLHVAGAPQFYISCGQIRVTSGGGGLPGGVSIPGYVSASDPGLTVNIYYPIPTSYRVPGPNVWRG